MPVDDIQRLPEQLGKYSPQEVLKVIHDATRGYEIKKNQSWWEDIIATTQFLVTRTSKTEVLGWADIAIACHLYLRDHFSYELIEHEQGALEMRLKMIKRFGPQAGHEVLDPQYIIGAFYEAATLPIDEVIDLIKSGDPISSRPLQAGQYYRLFGALSIVRRLNDIYPLTKYPDILHWIEETRKAASS